MNGKLLDIYRQQVLDHSREPHNRRRPPDADREVTGHNPLCGDKLTIYLQLDGETVRDAAFEGSGCAISVASASMLTEALIGTTRDEARGLIDEVEGMFADGTPPSDPRLEAMQALESVREYPSRIKCATLIWTAAESALDGTGTEVSTEYRINFRKYA